MAVTAALFGLGACGVDDDSVSSPTMPPGPTEPTTGKRFAANGFSVVLPQGWSADQSTEDQLTISSTEHPDMFFYVQRADRPDRTLDAIRQSRMSNDVLLSEVEPLPDRRLDGERAAAFRAVTTPPVEGYEPYDSLSITVFHGGDQYTVGAEMEPVGSLDEVLPDVDGILRSWRWKD